jgi:hypothetical protein
MSVSFLLSIKMAGLEATRLLWRDLERYKCVSHESFEI